MGYDYYCLLGTDGVLEDEEVAALASAYAGLVASDDFPRLGVVGHSGSGGLGCGMQKWARDGLLLLARSVPSRMLALWVVYFDLSGILRLAVQDDEAFEEEVIVAPDRYAKGPHGCGLMPAYPVGSLVIPHDIGSLLEGENYPLDAGLPALDAGLPAEEV